MWGFGNWLPSCLVILIQSCIVRSGKKVAPEPRNGNRRDSIAENPIICFQLPSFPFFYPRQMSSLDSTLKVMATFLTYENDHLIPLLSRSCTLIFSYSMFLFRYPLTLLPSTAVPGVKPLVRWSEPGARESSLSPRRELYLCQAM